MEIVLPFQDQVSATIAIQDHPSPAMIAGQNSFQMTIIQHDDMIQAITLNTADHALHIRIPQQVFRRRTPGKGFIERLRCALGVRLAGDGVQHPVAVAVISARRNPKP